MAIIFNTNEDMDAMDRYDRLNKKLALGFQRSTIIDVMFSHDQYGHYVVFQLKQMGTGASTASRKQIESLDYDKGHSDYYKVANDIAKFYFMQNNVPVSSFEMNVAGEIAKQFPSFEIARDKAGTKNALMALIGQQFNTWYTRTKNGRLVVEFCERQYIYDTEKRGYTGGKDDADGSKELNEDCPF